MKIKHCSCIMAVVFILISCQMDTKTNNEVEGFDKKGLPLPSWAKNATLYEVNTRHYTPEGTLSAFENHLPRLRSMGIDILWLMPIHPISLLKRKATNELLVSDIKDIDERTKYLGSPYAVADYLKVNPDLGTAEDFKNLVNSAHRKGMRVIIDWLANHTGWDHTWISEHPEWYTKDGNGNIVDPIDPNTEKSWGWTDVADLNYDNKDMRQAMLEAMKYWLIEFDIDGFRVDVAHGVPNDFWDELQESFSTLDKPVFLLAESEEPYHNNSGIFHATYGWSFHHLMNKVATGEKNAEDVRKWMKQDRKLFKRGFHIHFTSNHDENAWAGTVFERMGEAHKSMAVLAATLDGMPLLYSGQEEPHRARMKFFEKGLIHFGDYEYADFYTKLFEIKHENRALWNGIHGGEVTHLTQHEDVLAFSREKSGDKIIVIVNLSDEEQKFIINEDIFKSPDIFTGSLKTIKAGEEFEISAWRYYVIRE